MIFYFSGTGNSFWVAKELNAIFNERLINISEALNDAQNNFNYPLTKEEKVFFVFPVHSWGPAILVLKFIEKMSLSGYAGQSVFIVCTCGDNCGYTSRIINKALRKKSVFLTKSYSIQMPNNYILMKGFGVDPKEIEEEKLRKAPLLVKDVAENIQSNSEQIIYTTGSLPFLKSRIVYPLFRKFVLGENSFYAKNNCISCGLCVEVCPTKTVSLTKIKPEWGKNCIQCTACINRCPVHAIEYGKVTEHQGRYHHPSF